VLDCALGGYVPAGHERSKGHPTSEDGAGQTADATSAAEPSARRFRLMIEHISDTVSILGADGTLLVTTGHYKEILGYPQDYWEGRNIFDLAHPDDVEPGAALLEQLRTSAPGTEMSAELRARHADGSWHIIDTHGVNLIDDPDVGGIVLTTRNITAARRSEVLLASQARVLEHVARDDAVGPSLDAVVRVVQDQREDSVGAAFLLDDRSGAQHLRPSATDGMPQDVVEEVARTGLDPAARWPAALRSGEVVAVLDLAAEDVGFPAATELLAHGHRAAWLVPVAGVAARPGDGELLGALLFAFRESRPPDDDVLAAAARLASLAVDRSRAQDRLAHQAVHDALTGLPNRTLLLDRLAGALHRSGGDRGAVAVLFLDVDRFKVINDSLGHTVGDQVLVAFAERLREAVRPEDTVARFGGDELVVILERVKSMDEVRGVAARIEEALRTPFRLGESEVVLTCSIGIAVGEGPRDTPETVLRNADTAMYRAKERGRDRTELFDDELRARAVNRLLFENDLRRALRRDEIVVHYQPVVDLQTGALNGVEALVRWDHPRRGLVPPDAFVELAAETGLIVPLGRMVLEQAVADAARWAARHPGLTDDLLLAVNVSPRQLGTTALADEVHDALQRHGWPEANLALELTETELVDDADIALRALSALHDLGVKLCVDDFGTGYSSLAYLHRFPMDIVKIDRSFVASIGKEASGIAIATGVVSMAHALDQVAVAEGIETEEQLAVLQELGCDWGQGFLFAEPVDASGIDALLAGDRRLGPAA
jgi:diguanylate cyclase (GGDEF)-like protein/PAS domain S-box-containing protein